jgi:hypothetical protein
LNANVGTTNPKLYVVREELQKYFAFNMETLKQVQHRNKTQPQRKKYLIRNRRIIDLMDLHAKVLLTLDDYFIKISKTIGKKFYLI